MTDYVLVLYTGCMSQMVVHISCKPALLGKWQSCVCRRHMNLNQIAIQARSPKSWLFESLTRTTLCVICHNDIFVYSFLVRINMSSVFIVYNQWIIFLSLDGFPVFSSSPHCEFFCDLLA